MWIFGGARSKVRRIAGDAVEQHCADCARTTTHRPVKVKDSFHLFFIEFADMNSTGLQCAECGVVVASQPASTRQRIDANGLEELNHSAAHTHALALLAEADDPDPPDVGSAIRSRIADPDAISLRRKPRANQPIDHGRVDDELAALKAAARKK
jgi:hypothetical protein